MENSLVKALSDKEFKSVNRKILGHVRDVLGNSTDLIISGFATYLTGQPLLINYYSLVIKPFIEGYATFRDYVELEKVALFFDKVNELPFETRQAFSEKLKKDNDLEFTKNLIYSVSLLRNKNKAIITGKLFIALAELNINKAEFQTLLNIVENIDYSDLHFFKEKLDFEIQTKIKQLNRKDSLDRIDFLFHNYSFMEEFISKKNIFTSNGLINETILIQKVPKILGSYKEPDAVAKLRDSLTTVNVTYSISTRGALLYRYGLMQ